MRISCSTLTLMLMVIGAVGVAISIRGTHCVKSNGDSSAIRLLIQRIKAPLRQVLRRTGDPDAMSSNYRWQSNRGDKLTRIIKQQRQLAAYPPGHGELFGF